MPPRFHLQRALHVPLLTHTTRCQKCTFTVSYYVSAHFRHTYYMELVEVLVEGQRLDIESPALTGQDGDGSEDAAKSFSVCQLPTTHDKSNNVWKS